MQLNPSDRRGGMTMSTRPPAQVQEPVTVGGYPRRWFAAAAMMAAVLMDMIDVTIVNVALPTIRHDLGASATQLEWVVSAYMLAFATVLITAGSLGDLFGRKRLFLAGIAVFGLASLGAGLSGSAAELIAARVVQGAAAAVMTPQLLATFRTMFAGRERGQAFGIYGAVLGLASAVGLILGGGLTSADLFARGVPGHARDPGAHRRPHRRHRGAPAHRGPGRDHLSAAGGTQPGLAGLVLGPAGGGGGRPGPAGRGRGPPARPPGRTAAADQAVPGPGLHHRPGRPAGLRGRNPGLLPDLHAVGADRAALLAAARRADRGGVQRGQLRAGA